ncbi:phosphate-starvation-inducible PsiE family protein [Granulicella paludicola]|uniref:phosphate-starvation-inducible PsiE family protein n=1 Tax=Granulicella paludicola TaxID=474951 RepID=UPI0021E08774|nr:phosphate-starvation-inducible PsiE family protein [Granulicella paludicola]
MTRFFNIHFQKRWGTFSIYEKFEHLIISLLTVVIAAIVGVATWQLILHTFDLVRSRLLDPRDAQVFQAIFGMVLTVLIAMEFKHSLLIVLHQQRDIVQIRSVVLIALLALVRKFIILDIYQTQPAVVFALAASALSLGIVFWLVRNQDDDESQKPIHDESSNRSTPLNAA